MLLKHVCRGIAVRTPGVRHLSQRRTRGADSAAYCYSVWLRHLTASYEAGLGHAKNWRIVELGPGDSLGVGFAALLSGAQSYCGLDVAPYAHGPLNLEIFEQLLELFQRRAPIPGPEQFPKVRPELANYDFPAHILDEAHLARCLAPERVARLRRAAADPNCATSPVRYGLVSDAGRLVAPGAADWVLSQAVLEYAPDLEASYAMMRGWLSPRGFMSHQIDLKCHNLADQWNGHWTYSDPMWNLIGGGRLWRLNRAPYSQHAAALEHAQLRLISSRKARAPSQLRRSQLAPRFRTMPDEDLTTTGAFVIAAPQSGVAERAQQQPLRRAAG